MAAAVASPPKLYTNNPTETSIHVWWQEPLPAGVAKLQLAVREFPKPWADARIIDVAPEATSHTVTGLFPTSTFEFRANYVLADGTATPPGASIACDTLAAGCTPKDEGSGGGKKKSSCSVQ